MKTTPFDVVLLHMKSAKRSLMKVSIRSFMRIHLFAIYRPLRPTYSPQRGISKQNLHMTRSLEDLIRSEHRALESHHLLSTNEVISPHVDNMALKSLKWRAVIEETLYKDLISILNQIQQVLKSYLDCSIRLETLPQESLSAEKRLKCSSVKGLALLGNVIGSHGRWFADAGF